MPLVIQPGLTPQQVGQLLILRTYWRWENDPMADAELTAAEIAQFYDDLGEDDLLIDAFNDTRHQGTASDIPTRIHFSWTRNYEVDTHVIHLDDQRGLAFNYVTGGGKHGEPDAYPWIDEAWFVKCTGTQTVTTHTYEDIPDEPAKPE